MLARRGHKAASADAGNLPDLIAQAKFHYFRSFTQRKPMWLVPVSGEVPRRELGR